MDRVLSNLCSVLFLLLVQFAVAQSASIAEDQATIIISVVTAVFAAITIGLILALLFFLLWHNGFMNFKSKKQTYNFDDPFGGKSKNNCGGSIATGPDSDLVGEGARPQVLVTFYKEKDDVDLGPQRALPQIKESNLENLDECGTFNHGFTSQSSHSSQDDVFDESPQEKRGQEVKLSPSSIHKMREEAKKKRSAQPRTESSTPLLNGGGDTRTSESSGNEK